MIPYLRQIEQIRDHGHVRKDRTGIGTASLFGLRATYNHVGAKFPTVTTKKFAFKTMVSELLWFVSGSTNINDLKKIYPHNKIWDANYEDFRERRKLIFDSPDDVGRVEPEEGDMGFIYGQAWRNWYGVDQLQTAIDLIRNDPASRRILVNNWNPSTAHNAYCAPIPACHSFFQFFVRGPYLDCQMYQRSADMFLGVPFNVASYATLMHMIARITGKTPGKLIHVIGDGHIYINHLTAVKRQLERAPYPLPKLVITDRGQQEIDDFKLSDFQLHGYRSHGPIKAEMSV